MKATLDMITAVEYCENAINAGNDGFFMNTEFGKIAVETNPIHRVFVTAWASAPDTGWAYCNRDNDADWYVMIRKGKTKFVTHSRVLEALSTCLLMSIFNEAPMPKVVDAAIMTYLKNVDKKLPGINMLEHEYAHSNISVISRHDSSTHLLIREHISTRWDAAEDVLNEGNRIAINQRHGYNLHILLSYDEIYYRDLIAIILYMANNIARRDRISISMDFNEYNVIFNSRNMAGYIGSDNTVSDICLY